MEKIDIVTVHFIKLCIYLINLQAALSILQLYRFKLKSNGYFSKET